MWLNSQEKPLPNQERQTCNVISNNLDYYNQNHINQYPTLSLGDGFLNQWTRKPVQCHNQQTPASAWAFVFHLTLLHYDKMEPSINHLRDLLSFGMYLHKETWRYKTCNGFFGPLLLSDGERQT